MRIESEKGLVVNQPVKGKGKKTTDIFELIFNKNLKIDKDTKDTRNNSPLNEVKINISLKKLFKLEQLNNEEPKVKKLVEDFVKEILNENKSKLNLGKNINSDELINIKNSLLKNETELVFEVPSKKLNKFILELDKLIEQKINVKLPQHFFSNLVNEDKDVNKNVDKKKVTFDLNNPQTEKVENNEKLIENKELRKEKIDSPITSKDDPFEEIKKHRASIQNLDNGMMTSGKTIQDNSWQITNVKNDHMKIGDWIESFKQEIDKLSEFRIENKQKVSMFLKEQDEQLRIVVEKRGSYILVEAGVTDNMRDKLNNILTEVQNEMKEKGIEVRVEIKQDNEDKEENSREDNENQHQGGARDGKRHNKSDK